MSATARSDVRVALDVYPTPAWCVHRLLEEVELPGGHWCEPCAGDGAILRAVRDVRQDVTWSAIEIRSECRGALEAKGAATQIADALTCAWRLRPEPLSAVVTNPPYNLAEVFLAKALREAANVALLLRLDFLGSERRAHLLRATPPDVYVLPNRPSFVAGKTDNCEYAWLVWRLPRDRAHGRIAVLQSTERAIRRLRHVQPVAEASHVV